MSNTPPNNTKMSAPAAIPSVPLTAPVGGRVGIGVDVGELVGAVQQAEIEGELVQAETSAGSAQYPCPLDPIAHVSPAWQPSVVVQEKPHSALGTVVGVGGGRVGVSTSASAAQRREWDPTGPDVPQELTAETSHLYVLFCVIGKTTLVTAASTCSFLTTSPLST